MEEVMKSATATLEEHKEAAEGSVREKAVDAARQALHLSHEAHLLKTMAADAVEDGMYAAKRAVKTARRLTHEAADIRDEAAHRIRRDPFAFVGLAFGLGIPVGFLFGWLSRRPAKRIDRT
jgi:ElaB/YqjD/DUF883 family membrane-anchored ribosome-binding protein